MKHIYNTFIFILLCSKLAILTAQCDAPTNLQFSYANNVTNLTWDAVSGATQYEVEVRIALSTPWPSNFTNGTLVSTNSYSITGLMIGANLQWRVRAICVNGVSTATSASYNAPCFAPYNLHASNITTSAATLTWQQQSGINYNQTGFSVSYRRANTQNTWTQLTTIYNNIKDTFFILNNLLPGTAYEWRVRRVCLNEYSDYVIHRFTTLSCIPSGANTGWWINHFSLGSINRFSGAEPGAYANVPISTNLVIGSTNNTGQISVGHANNASNSKFMVFIDFNRNGSFADAGERLLPTNAQSSINGNNTKSFSLNIPANLSPGATRMRVIMAKGNSGITNSCIVNYLGETEDYLVNLVLPSNVSARPFINEAKTNNIDLTEAYPNPSNGVYKIIPANNLNTKYYEVHDLNGRIVVKNTQFENTPITLDLLQYAPGLYVLKLIDESGHFSTVKLLKE
jgi:hypothetical protein